MKKIKFFLAAFAAMATGGLYAQTDAEYEAAHAEIEKGGVYKIYTLSNGTETGTTKYYLKTDGRLTDDASAAGEFNFTIAYTSGGFKPEAFRLNRFTNGGSQNNEFSGESLTHIMTTGQDREDYEAQVFFKNSDGYAIRSTNAVSSSWGASAFWDVVAVAEADVPNATYTMDHVPFVWQLEKVTSGLYHSVTTKYITNYNPAANGDGWTLSATPSYDSGNNVAEYWNHQSARLSQTLTIAKAGFYELTAIALTREGYTTTLYAGNASMPIATVGSSTVNNTTQAKSWFNNKNGRNVLTFAVTEDNTEVEIGLLTGTSGDAWTVWRAFYLGYSEIVPEAEITSLTAKIPTEGTIPSATYSNLTSLKGTLESEKSLDAYNALQSAITEAEKLATDYARYNNIKTAALSIASSMNVSTADTEVEAATTTAAIDAAIATLRAAFLTELSNVAIPNDPGYIDVTTVMVDNASVRQNTNYWTIEGTRNNSYSWAVCNYEECEFYQQNFKFYQTLALTPGTWEFGVTGFHRNGNHSTYFYAGEDKILIPGVASNVVNSMAQAKTYFDEGNGKVSLKFLIETAGSVEIGIDNKDTETDKWTIFRDFTLKYYGAPDYTVYKDQWDAAVATANAAIDDAANANVTGQELEDLNTAISNTPNGSSKADYLAKINALTDATSAFIAAAPAYNAYVAYRAETVTLFGEALAATVAAPNTAAEATDAVHNLNIAQYNKVHADYTHSLNGLIGDFGSWTGTATVAGEAKTPNFLDDEHWSGIQHAYYEQAAEGWNSNSGWTIQYQKTCTLPAGDYVLKVAARSSANTTSSISCTATATVISLPNVGGTPNRGINTNGEASWSDDDTFANGKYNEVGPSVGGKGTGWQWRFLPFTLSEQGEVTMTFYAEASSVHQWMSIADGELLSANDVAQSVAYADDESNTINDVLVANVTISRNIKEGFNTICLPFDLTANQVASAFGKGSEVYAYSEASDDANSATINFNRNDGSISANTPVLVKATAASTEQVFNGVQIVAPGEAKVEGTNFDFVGTYAPTTVAEGDYFIGNGALYKSAGSTSMNAFRAYIHAKTGASVRLFIDDVETGIEAINGVEAEDGAIYNIAGQRLGKMQKGINIVNGKKIIK